VAIQPAARVQDILVVEDDEVLRELIALQLGNQGYKVRQAGTGNAALRQVADKPPDLILLDVNLPDLAGWEICARLKAEVRTQVIPIIILTALDSTRDRRGPTTTWPSPSSPRNC
jgi:DNA-binding response OmpR family regulator